MVYISQQMEFWRRIDNRCIEVVSIGKGNSDADTATYGKPVCGWQQAKDQLNGFPGLGLASSHSDNGNERVARDY